MFSITLNSTSTPTRSARMAALADTLRVTLARGAHVSFDARARDIDVLVISGSVWLTEDEVDHVLDGGSAHPCARLGRVVVTALADAVVEFRRHAE